MSLTHVILSVCCNHCPHNISHGHIIVTAAKKWWVSTTLWSRWICKFEPLFNVYAATELEEYRLIPQGMTMTDKLSLSLSVGGMGHLGLV